MFYTALPSQHSHNLLLNTSVVVLACFLGSCTTTKTAGTKTEESSASAIFSDDKRSSVITSVDQLPTSFAVEALIAQAKKMSQQDEMQKAVQTLERALRISPKSVPVHYHLSEVRLKQERYEQALQLALKGQSLLPENLRDGDVNGQFWQLLGDAYTAMGYLTKANLAYSKVP